MGSTNYICPIKELFANFEELDGDLMSMKEDHTCLFVGKGTIYIKMYDGTIRKLKEVRSLPRITKNLISVGAL